LQKRGIQLLSDAARYSYSFNFDWLSRPIIQHPQDIVAFQEVVWEVKPDLIIELGIARGGSLILSASLLALMELCDSGSVSVESSSKERRKVIGVDIDIRAHNRSSIESHALSPWITLIEGSSVDEKTISTIKEYAKDAQRIMVVLDSNHTESHVLNELISYAPLVSVGSFCVVFDTVIQLMPDELFEDREWGVGNNPGTAVERYLSGDWGPLKSNTTDRKSPCFEIVTECSDKLLITAAPSGFLRRTG